MYSFTDCQGIIEKAINSVTFNKEPSNLYEPIRYILSLGGKRIRPAAVLMACNLFSDSIDEAILPALGIEVFHNFTLMHDDIMDKSPYRRNMPTVHSKWNMNTAILSGDVMNIIAFQYFMNSRPTIREQIVDIFIKTSIQVCEGQQYDMDFENRLSVSEEEYVEMITLKTALLLACSFKMGAIIGNAGEKDRAELYEFGKNLGIAFQLQDDYLDTYADQATFGKKIGNDIITNKKTYLLIKALELSQGNTYKKLVEQITERDPDPAAKIIKVKAIFDELDIKQHIEEKIKDFFKLAYDNLEHLSVDESKKEVLLSFTTEISHRNF